MSDHKPVCLFAFANDFRQSLDLEDEWRKAEAALEQTHDQGKVEFHLIPNASLDDLYSKFNRFHNRIAVFHYGGHSDEEELKLKGRAINVSQLATLISQEKNLKLVFLNGCSNQGQVKTLFEKNAPVVIATSTPIEDEKARQLCTQFYHALAAGRNIKQSFELAASYVNDQEDTKLVQYRGLSVEDEVETVAFPWGLYANKEEILAWKIGTSSNAQMSTEHQRPVETPSHSVQYLPAETIDHLQNLLAKNRMKEVIKILEAELTEGDPKKELQLLSRDFRDLQKQKRMGIISYDEETLRKNKLHYAMYELIEELRA